jgi:hypothetical protein
LTWEVINPRVFEKAKLPVVPLMPDIHPIVDKTYKPYDIGQVGELDLHILTELFGGDNASRDLTPSWDGGIYWAGQRLSATTPAELANTKSISLFYLSAWKNAASAQAFSELYANALGRKYSGLHEDESAAHSAPAAGFSGGSGRTHRYCPSVTRAPRGAGSGSAAIPSRLSRSMVASSCHPAIGRT